MIQKNVLTVRYSKRFLYNGVAFWHFTKAEVFTWKIQRGSSLFFMTSVKYKNCSETDYNATLSLARKNFSDLIGW